MTENLLQNRINELRSAIVNIVDDKVHITGFYNEERLLSYLEQNKKNYLSVGLYDSADITFSHIIDNALFLVKHNGQTVSKHQYTVLFRGVVQRSKGGGSLVLTVRKNKFANQWQIITENESFKFDKMIPLILHVSENYKGNIELDNCLSLIRENEVDFITIDFETANASRDSICAIGIATYRNGKLLETFETLINPEDHFDPYNIDIHGITADMVREAPTFHAYYPTLRGIIQNRIVIAHYASFDISVIRHACNKYSLDYPQFKYSCTYQLSKKILPNEINYKLKNLSTAFDYHFNHHNALEDAKACGHILLNLIEEVKATDISDLLLKTGLVLGEHYPNSYTPSKSKKTSYNTSLKDITANFTEFDPNHIFFNKSISITGTLKSMPRREAAQKIVDIGGNFVNGITKDTEFLVIGDYDLKQFGEGFLSSKMKKARLLKEQGQNIEIIGEREFLKML